MEITNIKVQKNTPQTVTSGWIHPESTVFKVYIDGKWVSISGSGSGGGSQPIAESFWSEYNIEVSIDEEGYYNKEDDTFYEESSFTTPITPTSGCYYKDINSQFIYLYTTNGEPTKFTIAYSEPLTYITSDTPVGLESLNLLKTITDAQEQTTSTLILRALELYDNNVGGDIPHWVLKTNLPFLCMDRGTFNTLELEDWSGSAEAILTKTKLAKLLDIAEMFTLEPISSNNNSSNSNTPTTHYIKTLYTLYSEKDIGVGTPTASGDRPTNALYALVDVYGNTTTGKVKRSDGVDASYGDTLVYQQYGSDNGRWVAAPFSAGTVTGAVMNGASVTLTNGILQFGRVAAGDLISEQASSSNPLMDRAFINSSIATNTANFKGTFDAITDLGLTKPAAHSSVENALNNRTFSPIATNNDYCFVINTDSSGGGVYERYKASVNNDVIIWHYEFGLNNSSFTASQWAAINSGITDTMVANLHTHSNKSILDELKWDEQNHAIYIGDSNNPINFYTYGDISVGTPQSGGGGGGTTLTEVWNSLTNATQTSYATTLINPIHICPVAEQSGKILSNNGNSLEWINAPATGVTSIGGASGVITLGSNITISNNQLQLSGIATASALTTHTNNSTIHITSEERTTWNNKQGALVAGSNITISGSIISATDTTYSVATQSSNGLMSSSDKTKLNSIAFGTAGSDYIPITIGSTTKNVLTNHQSLSSYLTIASAASTYLPLSGGTLTGGLVGTTATFSSTLTALSLVLNGSISGATTGAFTGVLSASQLTLGSTLLSEVDLSTLLSKKDMFSFVTEEGVTYIKTTYPLFSEKDISVGTPTGGSGGGGVTLQEVWNSLTTSTSPYASSAIHSSHLTEIWTMLGTTSSDQKISPSKIFPTLENGKILKVVNGSLSWQNEQTLPIIASDVNKISVVYSMPSTVENTTLYIVL